MFCYGHTWLLGGEPSGQTASILVIVTIWQHNIDYAVIILVENVL